MISLRARINFSSLRNGRLFFQSLNKSKRHYVLSGTSCNKQNAAHWITPGLCKDYSTAAEQKESETVKGNPEKREFQAETRMLLDIVARSLYSDKEVFIRELISNASDALEKFRYLSVSSTPEATQLQGLDRALDIRLSTDKQAMTITIQDSGIGMTKEELTQNLGTIARSGSKSFIEEIKKQGADQASSIIGQFGVGFYSAFMVANKIEVFTRSSQTGSQGYMWASDGSGTYEIQEAENVDIGTKIVIYLKTDCREFADDDTVKSIIKKYSNFVSSPIFLNNEQVNSIKPLWLMEPKDVSQEQHIEFYKFISNSYDKPRFTLHYKSDAPISIRSTLYVPEGKPGLFEMSRDTDAGVALYSRKILIKSKADNILPKWMRFVKGVVDCEDIPLNLSRELLQNSALIVKLKTVLTNRFIKFMIDMSQKESLSYDAFYKDYSIFLKEGIVTSQNPMEKEEISKLLRFESSALARGERTSLAQYCGRAGGGAGAGAGAGGGAGAGAGAGAPRDVIYYLAAPSRELALSSPYYEALKKRDAEVLFCYETYDELVLLELKQFQNKRLCSLENSMADKEDGDDQDELIGGDGLSNSETEEVSSFLQSQLAGKVFSVKATRRLSAHPCVVVVAELGAARHFVRTQAAELHDDNRFALLRPQLAINPKHPIIKKLHKLVSSDRELASMVAQQLFSNAMVTAGLLVDPRNLIVHINELLVKALDKH